MTSSFSSADILSLALPKIILNFRGNSFTKVCQRIHGCWRLARNSGGFNACLKFVRTLFPPSTYPHKLSVKKGPCNMNSDGLADLELPQVCFMGIPVHLVDSKQLIEIMIKWGKGEKLKRVYNVNAHAINLACHHEDFMEYLRSADLVSCDGFGVKWGARILGIDIPHRLTPPDWIDDFALTAARAGQSIFALGDEEGVAASFQNLMVARHEGYINAGSHHGFFKKNGPENDAVIEQINASAAVHLLVGFGMPLQERWIEANRDRLKVKVALSVGALFRWQTGYDRRASRLLTDHGLEWFGRLLNHPLKHFRRYVIGNTIFVARVLGVRAGAASRCPDERH